MMKKLLFVGLMVFAASTLSAQSIGVKGGLGFSKYSLGIEDVSLKINPGTKTGFYVGGVANSPLSDNIGIQTELLYENGGFRLAGDGDVLNALLEPDPLFGSMKVKLVTHSIVMPVLLKYQASESLSLLAGAYASYRVTTSIKFNKNLSNLMLETGLVETPEDMAAGKEVIKNAIADNVARFNYGLSIGLEYALENGFFVDARFNQGLKNLSDVNDEADMGTLKPVIRSSSIQVGVGFRF